MRDATRLQVLRELVPLDELDCRAVVELLLLRRREGWEVFARHLELHPALDLHPPRVLPDALDVERLLLHQRQCALGHWVSRQIGTGKLQEVPVWGTCQKASATGSQWIFQCRGPAHTASASLG